MLKITWWWGLPGGIVRQHIEGSPTSHMSLMTPLHLMCAVLIPGIAWVAGDLAPIRFLWVVLIASGAFAVSYIHLIVVLRLMKIMRMDRQMGED